MDMTHNADNRGAECVGACCTKIIDLGVTINGHVILRGVNMHMHCKEIVAVSGENGAGKSTLFKALIGEVKHTGTVRFIDENSGKQIKPKIGYVPQHLSFDQEARFSVSDLFVACGTRWPVLLCGKRSRIGKRMRAKTLDALRTVNAEYLIDNRLGTLSGGELQRVMLALALDPVPNLLLLDEPVSGVDSKGLELFYGIVADLINKYDMSIALITHDKDLIKRMANREYFLHKI